MKDQCWHQESQHSIIHGAPLTLYVFGEVLDSWVAFHPLCEWNRDRRPDWNLSLSSNSALVADDLAEKSSNLTFTKSEDLLDIGTYLDLISDLSQYAER